MTKTVLCGVDWRDERRIAVQVARRLSDSLSARLVLVHVAPTPITPTVSVIPSGQAELASREERDEDERLIALAGFDLVRSEDTTANVVHVASHWYEVRARYRDELIQDETEDTFEGLRAFLSTVHTPAEQRRLCRYTFLGRRIDP